MGLSFLGPLFLAGLAALSLPVLVHLVRRSDAPIRKFPSLMFLSRIEHPVRQRRHIEHWGLLILRCLALALVVLSFAQPTFQSAALEGLTGERPRDVVLLVDQSYSMGYADHWRRARAAAHRALEELSPQDRAALVLFDTRAHVLIDLTTDRERVRRAIDTQTPSPYATKLAAGLSQAVELLSAEAADSARAIRVISDFQRTGWDPADAVGLPRDIDLSMLDITTPDAENAAVTVSGPLSEAAGQTHRVIVAANVVNPGARAVADRSIVLEVDGRELESRMASLSGRAVHTERFEVTRPSDGQAKATLRLQADELPADDRFHFLLSSDDRRTVLALGADETADRASIYLTRAFGVSEAPHFDVVAKPATRFQASDLDRVSAVVVENARLPGGESEQRLRQFVERGGGLLVIAGDRVTGQWSGGSNGYLPGRLGPVVKLREPRGSVLDWIDYDHPALTLFATPRSGDFTKVRVTRYRRLRIGATDTALARYEDGGIALAERVVGRGRVLVLTTTLDARWNDLPLQPAFVPLLHELMKYLVAYEPSPAWYTVGDVIDAASVLGARDQGVAVETPSGRKRLLPRERPVLRLEEPGWYELHAMGDSARSSALAVNVDPAESNLSPLDIAALGDALRTQRATAVGESLENGRQARDDDQEQKLAQRLWWYLLLAAAGLLAAETVWSNRISATTARSKGKGPRDSAESTA